MLTSPSGKSYVGQTTRPIEERIGEHRTGKSSDCVAIYNAIQYHGWENIEKDWYYCPDEDLNKHEELMVEVLGTLSPDGYNLREGGGSHGKMSEETKQKQREAHLGEKNHMFGKNQSEETKQKIGDGNRGKKQSEDTKQKKREAMLGKMLGEKHPMFGKKQSEDTKQKKRETNSGEKNYKSKRVYQYDLDGAFINSFGSTGEAGRHLEKHGANIRSCARGVPKYKTAYGFKWSYVKY